MEDNTWQHQQGSKQEYNKRNCIGLYLLVMVNSHALLLLEPDIQKWVRALAGNAGMDNAKGGS